MEDWKHTRTGVVAAAGAAFEESADLEGATIRDVAPMSCSLFDVPIETEMDGTTLVVDRYQKLG